MKRRFPLRARARARPIKIRKQKRALARLAVKGWTPAIENELSREAAIRIKADEIFSLPVGQIAGSYHHRPKCVTHPNYRGIYKPRLGCITCWPVYWHEHLIPTEYAGVDYITNLCKLYGKARMAYDTTVLTPYTNVEVWKSHLDKAQVKLIDLELLLHEAAHQFTMLSQQTHA